MPSPVLRGAVVGLLWMSMACSVVKMHRVRPDYEAVDRQRTRRIVVVVAPAPEGNAALGSLYGRLVRRYVNMKRDFLVKADVVAPEGSNVQTGCADGVDGVLRLVPQSTRVGDGIELAVAAQLVRCGDGEEVWAGEAAGSFPSVDERLVEVRRDYEKEFGPEVGPHVAPALNVLRPLLDTLPQPRLTDDDIAEKITLDD